MVQITYFGADPLIFLVRSGNTAHVLC